jgi:tripeptidyl-peptidase-1
LTPPTFDLSRRAAFRVPEPVSGTSCASPTAAGIIGLLNDERYQAKKPPLGFLNPWLYSNAASLNDITSGSNRGCGFSGGYPAAKGWDAVTGLGTPNFPRMSKAAAAALSAA